MYIIGWQLCVTYAGHLPACPHRASLTITQGTRKKPDKENVEHKGYMKAPKKKRSQGQKETSNHVVHMLPRSHKVWNITLHLLSSQANEHELVHFLNHSRSPWINFWVSLCSVRWSIIPSYNGAHIKPSLTILSMFFMLFLFYIRTKTL